MKPDSSDHDPLWDELTGTAPPGDFFAASLETMLAGVRAKRRARRLRLGAVSSAIIVLSLILALRGGFGTARPPEHGVASGRPVVPESRSILTTISDDELLDQFPGRPVALVDSGDSVRLVLLDER